mmetsp:Transcript_18127/g.56893  ORF Transcript_18127/g.56893 Transcript_18127/m.56893 type:complete len:243 (+) Transcript_18127:588-1316(+)
MLGSCRGWMPATALRLVGRRRGGRVCMLAQVCCSLHLLDDWLMRIHFRQEAIHIVVAAPGRARIYVACPCLTARHRCRPTWYADDFGESGTALPTLAAGRSDHGRPLAAANAVVLGRPTATAGEGRRRGGRPRARGGAGPERRRVPVALRRGDGNGLEACQLLVGEGSSSCTPTHEHALLGLPSCGGARLAHGLRAGGRLRTVAHHGARARCGRDRGQRPRTLEAQRSRSADQGVWRWPVQR